MNAIAIILIILMALAILVIIIVDYYKNCQACGEENLAVSLNELLANYVVGVILPIILPLIALWLKER